MDPSGGTLTPDQQASELRQFIQIASDAQIVNYMTVASLALLIHDIILTFPREVRVSLFPRFVSISNVRRKVEFVWKYRLTKGSALFVVMRYGNVAVQGIGLAYYLWPSPPFLFCKLWFYSEEWVSDILFIPVSIFLGLRTYALYRGQGVFYKWLIFTVVLISNIMLFISLALATAEVRFSELPFDGLTCSFTISGPPETAGLVQFVASTFFDATIFCLSAIRCYQHYTQGNIRIIKIIFQSCLGYFAFLFSSGAASMILYKTLPKERAELLGVLINPMRTIAVIITSRMVLTLRSIVLTTGPLNADNLAAFPYDNDGSQVSTTTLQWRVASHRQNISEFEMHNRHD